MTGLAGWMTGLSGVLPSGRAGILHGRSWLHPHDRFDNFRGGIWKTLLLRGKLNFFMAFTWSTVVVACLANSSPNNIGAEETKLLLSFAMNSKEGVSFKISFFLRSCAICWCGFPIKYRAVWVAETDFFSIKSPAMALSNKAARGATVSNQNCCKCDRYPSAFMASLGSTAFSTPSSFGQRISSFGQRISSFGQRIWSKSGILTFPTDLHWAWLPKRLSPKDLRSF